MKIDTSSSNANSFRIHATHSPEEILAAGGATAFGKKTKKNNEKLILALEKTPSAEPFSLEEWEDLIGQLDNTK